MLTSTYALLTLSIEQKNLRTVFASVQHYFQDNAVGLQNADRAALESVMQRLDQLEASFHLSKIKLCLIPVLKKTSGEADPLLDELETLGQLGNGLLKTVKDKWQQAFVQASVGMEDLYHAMNLYHHNLIQRLNKEEELLALAQRIIPSEQWFTIGVNFLSFDAESKAHGRRLGIVSCKPYARRQSDAFTLSYKTA